MVRRISHPSTTPFSLWEQGYLAGLQDAGMSVRDVQARTSVSKRSIAKYTSSDLTTPLPRPIESELQTRRRKGKTIQEENKTILDTPRKKPSILIREINESVVPSNSLSAATLKRCFKEQDMCKWLSAKRSELEEKDATRQLAWALDHQGLTAEN